MYDDYQGSGHYKGHQKSVDTVNDQHVKNISPFHINKL